MKIALLGNGKTGQYVQSINPSVFVFNSSNQPTLESLAKVDIIISFLPGDIFQSYIPLLIKSKKPVVTGSTGFDWPSDIDKTLKENNLKWIYASNFSVGINIVKTMIETLSKASELFEDYSFSIKEIHHTKKIDAPSGTAISFQKWLDKPVQINSKRTGDIIGEHQLTFSTKEESISINHTAHDRSLFAKGALWASKILVEDSSIPYGLNNFNQIVSKHLNI